MHITELKIDDEFKQLIPPLQEDEYKKLETSIIEDGCRDALVLWDDILLDGHNRYKICKEHGIIFKTVQKNLDDRDAAKIWIINTQLGRRNLIDAQRIELTEKLIPLVESIKKEMNERKQQATGKPRGTKKSLKVNLPEEKKTSQTRDKLGHKAGVSGSTYGRAVKVRTKKPELWKQCLTGDISIDAAYKEVNEEEKSKKKQQEKKQREEDGAKIKITDKDIKLLHGDFRKVLKDVPDKSIDLIITDPPYGEEYLSLMGDLSKIASRVLKSNGFCIVYSGLMFLPSVMNELEKSLKYYWTLALVYPKTYNRVLPRNILQGWKTFLVYQNGFKKLDKMFFDVIQGSGRAKKNHNWEQSYDELKGIIDFFTKPGDTILDPMAGSCSTLIISKKMNRKTIGCELNEKTYNAAKGRLSQIND